MEKLILKIKDEGKLNFFLELLKQFDFVEVQKVKKEGKKEAVYDFFESSGLWSGREIHAESLRKQAWERKA